MVLNLYRSIIPVVALGSFSIQVVDANCSITLPTLTLNPIRKRYTIQKQMLNVIMTKGLFSLMFLMQMDILLHIYNGTLSGLTLFFLIYLEITSQVLRYSITESNGAVTTCLDTKM
jgi:hypothetical protein